EFLDFMSIAFPGAKLVFNLRTGDAIAKSGWWSEQEPSAVLAKLRGHDEKMRAYAARHTDNCVVLNYDDYVSRPECLAPLFALLGVPYDEEFVKDILADRLPHGRHAPAS